MYQLADEMQLLTIINENGRSFPITLFPNYWYISIYVKIKFYDYSYFAD